MAEPGLTVEHSAHSRGVRYHNRLSYTDFLEHHLLTNTPCLIGPQLTASWRARTLWAPPPSSSIFARLTELYGDQRVSVAFCDERDFSDQRREEMLLREVMERHWAPGDEDGPVRGEKVYVKDWHLALQLAQEKGDLSPEAHEPFYETPDLFKDDWLNGYYTAHTNDDFRFVYAGSAGTWTGLHRDVYRSYSWSTNVFGRKIWRLFPPSSIPLLHSDSSSSGPAGELAYDVRDVDQTRWRSFEKAHEACIVVVQEEGETIFVPSNWYHQVENLTDCISINHNWANSVNLLELYDAMKVEVSTVSESLADVREMLKESGGEDWEREWSAVVQDLCVKDAGWGWHTFFSMLLQALSSTFSPADSSPPVSSIALDTSSPTATSASSPPPFPPAPPSLHPPLPYILSTAKQVLDDFETSRADELRWCEGVAGLVRRARGLVGRAEETGAEGSGTPS